MYVKIIKGSGWYEGMEDAIFEVVEKPNHRYFLVFSASNAFICKSDCEEISLDFDDQISEEFARKILNCDGCDISPKIEFIIGEWKRKGYIKQSREDELREKLKELYPDCTIGTGRTWNAYNAQKELIQILDKKCKE